MIVPTKTFVPLTRKNSVSRKHLIEKLISVIEPYGKVTIVSAPAGYGKTTLIAESLKKINQKCAWLTLDTEDSNIYTFISYIIAALQNVCKGIGQQAKTLLESPQLPEPESIATLLINDMISAAVPCVIVLDDYHTITDASVHRAIEFLIEHSPDLLHTVIITRQDPPLPLSKWRVRGQVNEIRIEDLRFTEKEAEEFFRHTMRLKLSAPQIASLHDRTEGWVAGLQLAALSLQGRQQDSVDEFINRFYGNHRYIIDYLFEEVLNSQKEDIKRFLCKTSVLQRFNSSLCDGLTDRNDSRRLLLYLEEANLFLIPLDDERQWYRYHHLFAEFLRTELCAQEEVRLHQKAALWFEKNGFIAEAIDHALVGEETEKAIMLIKQQLNDTLLSGKIHNVISWLDRLPGDVVCRDAVLCSYKACAHFLLAETEKAFDYISVYRTIAVTDELSNGRVKSLDAWFANICDKKETIALAQEALQEIGENDPGMKAFTLVALAQAQRGRGNLDGSDRAFSEALLVCKKAGYTLPICTIAMDLAYNGYVRGNLQQAISFCTAFLKEKSMGPDMPLLAAGLMNIPLGTFLLEANEIKLAEECILKGIEISKKIPMSRIFGGDGERILAKIRYIQGQKDEAIAILHEKLEELTIAKLPLAALRFHAVLADIYLRTGNIEWAENWLNASGLSIDAEITSLNELPYLVYARYLITTKHFKEARFLLDRLECFSRSNGREGRLIGTLVLKSLLCSDLGCIEMLKDTLSEAVVAAAGENYRRPFLDEGEKIISLLSLVKNNAPDFIARLIDDYKNEVSHRSSLISESVLCSDAHKRGSEVYEQLSERELEILQLIAEGYSNGDIAARIYISIGTVKWHINHIFAKLRVTNRTQAVKRARELMIIAD